MLAFSLITALLCWLLLFVPAASDPPAEKHLQRIQQLTLTGDNGEAYFSADGKKLIFQSKREGYPFDQIFTMDLEGRNVKRVSPGRGRATCSYYDPLAAQIIYASTHHAEAGDPTPPSGERQGSYDWSFDPHFDIFLCDLEGNVLRRLTREPGYDAEATFSPSGKRIVFTSSREGDLEVYSMARDGSDVRRLTHMPGYDGGAFYSPDERQIVFRGARGQDYRALQLFLMNADGSEVRQLTHWRGTSFAPYWHPSGRKVIFSSNHHDLRNFDLFLLDLESRELERVTFHPSFDGFPVFSPDGKFLVFASNRAATQEGATHIFIAEWVD